MHLQKHITILLLTLSFSFTVESFANNSFQETTQSFDEAAFKASLKELPPKEFARLFMQQYRGDSIKTILCIKHVKNNMLSSENLEAQFWGYYSLAQWQNNNMNHEKSIDHIDNAYDLAKKLNNEDLILSALINKGNFHYEFGEYEKSMEYNLEALELAKETNNIKRELVVSLNMALIKMQTNDNESAIELLKKNLEVIES
jgi:tetratricopeptide (TPR) repeat protein